MQPFFLDPNESERLEQLQRYRVVGTEPEAEFDHIARLASTLFQAPIAVISFVDDSRLWLKARIGVDVCQVPRDVGFCSQTILGDRPMVVPDLLQDDRFASNPLVRHHPKVRFYAGCPLIVDGGHRIGTLCIMDVVSRPAFSAQDEAQLSLLASLVVDRLERRRSAFVNASVRGYAETTSDALLCIDDKGVLTFANQAALQLFGYSAKQMIGHKLDLIVPERFRAAHGAGVARVVGGGTSKLDGKTVEIAAVRSNGDEFPIEISICMWRDHHGFQMGASVRDISERKERDLRLHRLAHQDPLTGLANRLQIEAALARSYEAGVPAVVLLLDLDGFKGVNDGLGHAAGDALLQALALRLQAVVDARAVVGRMGGDEFAIVLPESGDPLRAGGCASAILSALEAPVRVVGHEVHVGVSIGGAIAPNHGCDAEEIVASADLALYRAKAEGGRCFRLFEPTMRNAVAVRRALQDELRQAVRNAEFVLHYQPQIDLRTGAVFGAEALLRWRHPTRGLLLPGAFMATLESHALATEVGAFVLDEACRQTASWRQAGLAPIRMSINLSAAQVRSGRLVAAVVNVLARYGLSSADLELEVTETIALQNDERVLQPLRELKQLGCGLAFDDFGTGYASLSTLKRVPLTTLKIDRGFVMGLLEDAQDAAVVEAVISLGRRLGLVVIAEGIETVEQEAALQRLGCPAAQGFLYSPGITAEAFGERLRSGVLPGPGAAGGASLVDGFANEVKAHLC